MLILPHTLSLIVTHRCTAACEHCCFTCNPDREESIPVENIARYIDQAVEYQSIKCVVFTGGECFLLGENLDKMVQRAHDHGFGTRFVSNGYWAFSLEAARRRIDKLVKVGLDEANFSTGDAHAQWVPPERVRNGAIAAAERGLMTCIMIEAFKESTFDLDAFVDHEEFQKYLEDGRIILKYSPWMTFEGDLPVSYSSKFVEVHQVNSNGCDTCLNVLTVTPTEDLVACCGLPLEKIPELHLGSLKTTPMKQLTDTLPNDFIKIWVHVEGPLAVLKFVESRLPGFTIPKSIAHQCDFCLFMYKHPDVQAVLRRELPSNATEIVTRFRESLMIPRTFENTKAKLDVFKSSCSLDAAKKYREYVK